MFQCRNSVFLIKSNLDKFSQHTHLINIPVTPSNNRNIVFNSKKEVICSRLNPVVGFCDLLQGS
jgi:hypothetical protein